MQKAVAIFVDGSEGGLGFSRFRYLLMVGSRPLNCKEIIHYVDYLLIRFPSFIFLLQLEMTCYLFRIILIDLFK